MIKVANQYGGFNYDIKPTLMFKFHGSKQAVEEEIQQVKEIVQKFESGTWNDI